MIKSFSLQKPITLIIHWLLAVTAPVQEICTCF